MRIDEFSGKCGVAYMAGLLSGNDKDAKLILDEILQTWRNGGLDRRYWDEACKAAYDSGCADATLEALDTEMDDLIVGKHMKSIEQYLKGQIEECRTCAEGVAPGTPHSIECGAREATLMGVLGTFFPKTFVQLSKDPTEALRTIYGDWGQHEQWSREDWQQDVGAGDTQLGYWEWVWHNLESNGQI